MNSVFPNLTQSTSTHFEISMFFVFISIYGKFLLYFNYKFKFLPKFNFKFFKHQKKKEKKERKKKNDCLYIKRKKMKSSNITKWIP